MVEKGLLGEGMRRTDTLIKKKGKDSYIDIHKTCIERNRIRSMHSMVEVVTSITVKGELLS